MGVFQSRLLTWIEPHRPKLENIRVKGHHDDIEQPPDCAVDCAVPEACVCMKPFDVKVII